MMLMESVQAQYGRIQHRIMTLMRGRTEVISRKHDPVFVFQGKYTRPSHDRLSTNPALHQ